MTNSSAQKPVLVIDSREKEPYSFSCLSKRAKLEAADYSIEGFETRIALERKSLADLVHTVTWCRDRFHHELIRLKTYDAAAIIVEGTFRDIVDKKYTTNTHPNAIIGSVLSIIVDFGIPVYFCCDRQAACHFVERLLIHYHRRFVQCQINQQTKPRESGGT